ncbi:MAG: alcohol dehydrogenase catalytic domain-containing protein [Ramlibacter sp.]|uniref:alcohol dehydrogenase catalytic domain-containing protein n=1 Tax=Ramlibacter sp. TaxID=1917967 RepID=UPI00261AFE24|nr:alcohol dehydrogenase catalytic domain-containing protein [Ramlibacter sp.]MDH4377229.1 alcohol dehydrogenase catalytic domain-containing protein [Ramlibacter sp.]
MQSYGVTEWGKPLQQIVRETPAPGPNEVLIRMSYCGVCHSDLHVRQGYFDMGGGVKNSLADRIPLPVVLGHEPIGVVAAVGSEVSGVPVGATYLVNPWIGCGKCPVCLQGQDNLCERMASLGIARPGGFSTHLMVPDKRYLVDVDGIDPARAAVLACSGVTAYSAVTKLGPPLPGHWLAVIGCGGLGLIGIAILRALGYTEVIACDIDDSKLEAARAAGAQQVLNLQRGGGKELVAMAQGGLAGMIDFVGAPSTSALAVPGLRKGGRFVTVGLIGGTGTFPLVALALREIALMGSAMGNTAQMRELVELVRSGRLTLPAVQVRPLAQAEESLQALEAGQVTGRIVLDTQTPAG